MNTADYIVKKLEELGVNDFFGVPGDYNFDILYSIESNSHTNWIGCTNELNAGYAADGYARIRGYGALVTTYGVGELSAINAIAGANAENVPIVHIVGVPCSKDIDNKKLIHHNFQDADYNAFINSYKSVTAATAFLTKANAKIEIDRVFKTLVKEKRPVYIALPSDVAQSEISDRYVSLDWNSNKDCLNEVGEIIINKINNSKNPVIVGDILVKRFDALLEYKEFVAKTGIPTTNFLMGFNLIDMNYEKYIGGYFGNVRNPIAENYINNSDCIISVGAIYSDLNSFGQKLSRNINNDIAIYGTYTYVDGHRYDNVKMSDLLDFVTNKIETKNIEIEKPNIGYKTRVAEKTALTSSYIYPRFQEFIKDNDIIFAETGTVPYGICCMNVPESVNLQTQFLWGSIGWATPAAFGACIAKPQSRVVLVTGEGAHQISAIEIGNMLKHNVKPVVIVINNDGYSIERILSDNVNREFNNIVKMNYSKFARAFDGDIWSTHVDTEEDFDKALRVTQIMNKMCYLEVCVDKLDIPNIVKDLISELKGFPVSDNIEPVINLQPEKTSEENTNVVQVNTDFEYETVVHQSFINEVTGENNNG